MASVSKAHFIIIFIFGVLIFFLSLAFFNYVEKPMGADDHVINIQIPRGATFSDVTRVLERSDLIKHKYCFYLLAFLKNAQRHIKYGEYEIDNSLSPGELLDKLTRGEIKTYPILIPEGFTIGQIASILAENKLVDRNKFVNAAKDKEFLSALHVAVSSLEGYLFPDTYTFARGLGEYAIIKTMVANFRKKVTKEMRKQAAKLGFTWKEIIVLASIIEKEGGPSEEKPFISSVFHNRLKKGMRLQSDPTVIYGLENFDGNLTKKDLLTKTPYNTYLIKGLPPGPICNPGLDSILAALFPASSNFLYFVSKNNGNHHFSSNLASHNQAVVKYQIKRRK